MRYARTSLAAATVLLALTTLNGTAHANNDHGDGGDTKTCTINNTGNHNTGACGDISHGDNATTGQWHTIGATQFPAHATFTVMNNSSFDHMAIVCTPQSACLYPDLGVIDNGKQTTIYVLASTTLKGQVNGATLGSANIAYSNNTAVATCTTGCSAVGSVINFLP
ncbi:hypothetical protein [Streptomyces sp. NBC_01264]|uniref:hypothetical protein n=1 Tax=Streptomyces sp. NBC_01264 TaxID=2903804 RepID=UPI002258D230|nr:hypothetical protein [Streptomyces sp. NBC_01264]MCX4784595.1 hypothetical protein [Streptomyces sp. NBC_01264]